MKKTALFLIVAILICSIPASAATVPNIEAPSYYLATLDTGAVLVEENCSASITPGEFSKIMTALVAVEKLKPDDAVVFEEEDVVFYNSYANIANIKPGETLTVRQHLCNMLLLYSDASANALARQISGDSDKFTEEMNKKAKEMKMENTLFTSPSGNDKPKKSKISVNDLASLARTAYENKTLKEIFATVLFEINGEKYSSRNHLLSRYTYSDFTYSPASGMLVCTRRDTSDIVSTASNGNLNLLSIVIGSPNSTLGRHYLDTINLFEYGFNNFSSRTVSQEKTILDQAEVRFGNRTQVTLETAENCLAYTPTDFNADLVTYKITKEEKVWAPVKKGDVLGNAVFYYEGLELASVPLVASENVNFSLLRPVFSLINSKFLFMVVVLAVIYLALRYNSLKKKEERRKRREKIKNQKD